MKKTPTRLQPVVRQELFGHFQLALDDAIYANLRNRNKCRQLRKEQLQQQNHKRSERDHNQKQIDR